MSILGLELTPQPEKDANKKRKEMREVMTGVRRHPVEKKEQQKPHPDEPNTDDNQTLEKL